MHDCRGQEAQPQYFCDNGPVLTDGFSQSDAVPELPLVDVFLPAEGSREGEREGFLPSKKQCFFLLAEMPVPFFMTLPTRHAVTSRMSSASEFSEAA